MIYKIPVYWTMYDTLQIEASSLEEAIEKSYDEPLSYGDYVDGSFTIEFETLKEVYFDEVRDSQINKILK